VTTTYDSAHDSEGETMAVGTPGIHAHVGVVTSDLDAAMVAVGDMYGLSWTPIFDGGLAPPFATGDGAPSPGLVRTTTSTGGPMRIELLQGQPGSVWYTTELTRLHHVAYWVDDVAASAAPLVADGWTIEVTLASAGPGPVGFAYLTKPGHARLELTDGSDLDTTLAQLGWAELPSHLR
jgi:Glyoxalase/Bleomycin resistance protein/Dioxygenase superfamily